jgi:dTDP-4-amino-4,6-dideoxygalactose transaminase
VTGLRPGTSSRNFGDRTRYECRGRLRRVVTFSFQGSKSLNCGEGGALVTDDPRRYEATWAYHHIGRGLKAGDFAFTSIGPNYRLSELAAAVLCTQPEKFPAQARTRARNAEGGGLRAATGYGMPVYRTPVFANNSPTKSR